MEMTEICTEAVAHYGDIKQLVKAVEEMSELTKEVCKATSYGLTAHMDGLTEEIVDVEIMLEQLKIICGNRAEVASMRDQKLQRLQRRINGDPG